MLRYSELSQRFDELFQEVELDLRQRCLDKEQARKVCPLLPTIYRRLVAVILAGTELILRLSKSAT